MPSSPLFRSFNVEWAIPTVFLFTLSLFAFLLFLTTPLLAQETDQDMPVGAVGGAVHADLFTGTATTSIPIEVPPGRGGIQPELALVYGSANGNGWVGMGWKLEKGVVERQTKFGVDYSGDDYVFRLSGINVELVNVGSGEYRAKIEGGFTRVEKLTATDGKPYFIATDKTGKKFYFGQVANTRVVDPADADKIFRWCLDRVEDPNGNYMTLTYTGDQGQSYLTQIDYTGHGTTAPTNSVVFHLENRPDVTPMYVPNFEMTTAKRLKTIEVQANGSLVRAYALAYTTSAGTNHSLLSNVQQFGKDATFNGGGGVISGTSFPPIALEYPNPSQGFESLPGYESVPFSATVSFDGGDGGVRFVDLNGDGKQDVIRWSYTTNGWYGNGAGIFAALNTGSGWERATEYESVPFSAFASINGGDGGVRFVDLNGDGKQDVIRSSWTSNTWYGNVPGLYVAINTGMAWQRVTAYETLPFSGWISINGDDGGLRFIDLDGDGKLDAIRSNTLGISAGVQMGFGEFESTLAILTNGLGATTTIEYTPSTQYANTQLPFPVQTVSKITTDDGNGNVAETTYEYAAGFHHIAERDFRGFNHVKVNGPAGPSGEQTITETWFHQGNDTAVDVNDPNVADGYLKGAPYRTKVTDGSGNLYTQTTTTYTADDDGNAPFFTPPASVVTEICGGNSCGKETRTDFTYDSYGNVTEEYQYGDTGTSDDDRTVVRTFDPNTTDWIVSLPASEIIHEGLGTGGTQMARTDFYYDGTTSCSVASTNQQPTEGNLTRVVRWLSGGTSPETRMAYDSMGNITCTRDANGNTTTMAYDASGTFATSVTNPLDHVTSTTYYGVNSVPMDDGLYGQVKSVTDPNGAVVTTEYDALGRRTTVTQPDGFWTTTSYVSFGTVGSQHVKTESQLSLSTWTYFDGLGRTIKSKSTGTDGKIIVTETEYDARGAVTRASLPYFETGGTPLWSTNVYDAMGRVVQTTAPDGTRGLSCHDDWVAVTIDANDHQKRTVRDAYGRVQTVQEYSGTFTTCSTSVGTPYATTTYQYDVLGNLVLLTDALGNQSTMGYDTLSRKTGMHDPDMGDWTYQYDANGNLILQTDAKDQDIHFQYDSLNRRVQKDYDTQKTLGSGDVVYTYDGTTNNRKGRLQQVDDASGTTKFYYDVTGRVTKTDKVVDSTTYTTKSAYDGLGRVTSVTYPNSSTVTQSYNGPQFSSVQEGSTTYAAYSGFNALGQPGTLTLGNGTATTYTYYDGGTSTPNFRLKTLKTVKGSTVLQDLGYTFDEGGNVTALTDAVHTNQSFSYDDLDRLTSATGSYGTVTYSYNEIGNMLSNSAVGTYSYPTSGSSSVRPHAVSSDGTNSYTYDANGNMILGAGRIITYDFENRPDSVIKDNVTTTFVYDGDGGRFKKSDGTTTTIYIGKLYACEGTNCVKFIFAGGQRIAMVQVPSGSTSYSHADHLGSTSVLTDASGNSEEDNTYYPYGAIDSHTGTSDVAYKYTGKERDTTTGLYFYEARYYDPVLGRFISPDTIVPSPTDPQALNRYSYARNSPIVYNDPSGHCFGLCIAIGAIVGAISAGIQSDWDFNAVLLGAVVGGVAGGYGGFVGSEWSTLVSQSVGGSYGAVVGGVVGGAVGGTAAGVTSAALYRAAGYDVNIGTAAYTGAASGAIFGVVNGHYGKTWTPPRVIANALAGGAASQATGKQFVKGFVSSLVISGLSYTAFEMRQAMIRQSRLNPNNLGKESVGAFGDGTGIAGTRQVEDRYGQPIPLDQTKPGLLGGHQGGQGQFFGIPYSKGDFLDYALEIYAGPHDFFNSGYWYNSSSGNAVTYGAFGTFFGEGLSGLNVIIATPFAAGSVVGNGPLPFNIDY